MTPKPNTRGNRRNAQIAAVKELIGCDANTALISAVFPEPFDERDAENAVIKERLLEVLAQLTYNIAPMTEKGSNASVADVMKQFPRLPPTRKGRK